MRMLSAAALRLNSRSSCSVAARMRPAPRRPCHIRNSVYRPKGVPVALALCILQGQPTITVLLHDGPH